MIVVCMFGGCFGTLKTDTVIYTHPDTGYQVQSWLYSPSATIEETKKKLIQRILKSSLFKACIGKGGIPRATYSEPIMSSLMLTCRSK